MRLGLAVAMVVVVAGCSCSANPQPGTDQEKQILEEATSGLGDPIDKFLYYDAAGRSFAVESVDAAQDAIEVPDGFVADPPAPPGPVAPGGIVGMASWGDEQLGCVIELFEVTDLSLSDREIPELVRSGDEFLVEVHVGC